MSQSRVAHRILDRMAGQMYPTIKCDQFSLPYYNKISDEIKRMFNKMPLKAKNVLKDCTIYLSSAENIHNVSRQKVKVLGITRPGDCMIVFNVERFVTGEDVLDADRFESLFYHETGHYLIHNFTEKEKAFYFKLFGTEPVTTGEPEADGFAAYMLGAAPYHVQEFWSWWAANNL